MINPLKVEAIIQFSSLQNIRQLQSLQGKTNFLHCFIANYANITKGFICLLKKGVPFIWDEFMQRSFDALKYSLVCAPLLSPLDYIIDFFLYTATTKSTIGMVLVQEDDDL